MGSVWFRVFALTLLLLRVGVGAGAPVAALGKGIVARIRLTDYVNTDHQPMGFAYRGVVEGNVLVAGKVAIPDKSTVLMRLVSGVEGMTVEWWAVKYGDEWSEFRPATEDPGLFTKLVKVTRPSGADVGGGAGLHIPFKSVLQFEVARPIRIVYVGRARL